MNMRPFLQELDKHIKVWAFNTLMHQIIVDLIVHVQLSENIHKIWHFKWPFLIGPMIKLKLLVDMSTLGTISSIFMTYLLMGKILALIYIATFHFSDLCLQIKKIIGTLDLFSSETILLFLIIIIEIMMLMHTQQLESALRRKQILQKILQSSTLIKFLT